MSAYVKTITDLNFDQEVLKENKAVLVDFWAQWCGPCRALTPILEEVAEAHHDKIIIAKINIDENPQTPTKYGVMSIPTLILFKNGQVAGTKVGLLSKAQLVAFIGGSL